MRIINLNSCQEGSMDQYAFQLSKYIHWNVSVKFFCWPIHMIAKESILNTTICIKPPLAVLCPPFSSKQITLDIKILRNLQEKHLWKHFISEPLPSWDVSLKKII